MRSTLTKPSTPLKEAVCLKANAQTLTYTDTRHRTYTLMCTHLPCHLSVHSLSKNLLNATIHHSLAIMLYGTPGLSRAGRLGAKRLPGWNPQPGPIPTLAQSFWHSTSLKWSHCSQEVREALPPFSPALSELYVSHPTVRSNAVSVTNKWSLPSQVVPGEPQALRQPQYIIRSQGKDWPWPSLSLSSVAKIAVGCWVSIQLHPHPHHHPRPKLHSAWTWPACLSTS